MIGLLVVCYTVLSHAKAKRANGLALKAWHEGFHAGEQAAFIRSLPIVRPDPKPED